MRRNDDLHLALRAGRLTRERVVKLPSRNMRAAKSAAIKPHYRATPFKTSERMQDVVVQAQYVMSEGHKWAGHGHYLAREGANREGEQGLGFDAEHEDRDMANTLNDWQSSGDERHWRIMISPEQGGELNLPDYTRQVVAKMEIDLKTKLEWVAIDHYNTAHPHVHLLLRGVDDKGRMYWMDDGYVKSGIRGRAKEIATRELGLRTEQDLDRSRTRLIDAERFTAIDRAILKRAREQVVTHKEQTREAPELKKALQESKRTNRLIGEVADPVAQDILARLSQGVGLLETELSSLGIGPLKPLAGGASAVVLDAGNKVVRLTDRPIFARPEIADVLQADYAGNIAGLGWEVLPKADTSNITETDVNIMFERLSKQGYVFADPGTDNLGRVNGRLVVIDPGAIQAQDRSQQKNVPIRETLNYLPQKNKALVVTYEGKISDNPRAQDQRLQEMGRLQTLAAMGLAEKTGPKTWQFSPDTEVALRQLQRSKDIIKTRAHERTQNQQRQFVGRIDEIERMRGRS